MDLRDIEYFAVIAEHRHLGRAAEALGLGQPALSISLRRLEQAAEAKLVRRTPKGVELTDVGNALLSHVRRLQLARDDLAREVADLAHGRAGHLRIAASPANAELFLPEASSALLMEAPKVTMNIAVLDNDALLPTLRKGDVDLVVHHTPQFPLTDLAQESVRKDEFVVYCAASHKLAKRKSLLLEDLAQERWASTTTSAYASWRSLHRAFQDLSLPPPRTTLVTDSVILKLRAVATSDLLGVGVRHTVQAASPQLRLAILPVRNLDWVRPVAIAHRQDTYLSPAAKRFIEILKKTANEITNEQ